MLLAILAITVGAAAGHLSGGRFRHVTDARVAATGWLIAGGLLELAGNWVGQGHFGLAVLVAGYAAMLVFAVANLRLVGMILVLVGLAANLTVFAADGGMPVRGVAPGASIGARHHGERPGDRLTALGDVVAVPPLGETVSAGDLCLTGGATVVLFGLMRPRRRAVPTR